MDHQHIFTFKADISEVLIPEQFNNPFGSIIPEIGRIAALEFQDFIESESKGWVYNFNVQKGKMFGVLVVRDEAKGYGYLGTNSGKTPGYETCKRFVPSIFDDSSDAYFINKGMTDLTEIGHKIKKANKSTEISALKQERRLKSHALQKQLFENYQFLNVLGKKENPLPIFERSSFGKPPAATGECAAPKLLQYAFENGLKPIAMAEFWWGNPTKDKKKEHGQFYAACKDKCRPILEYMLDDKDLFERARAADHNY